MQLFQLLVVLEILSSWRSSQLLEDLEKFGPGAAFQLMENLVKLGSLQLGITGKSGKFAPGRHYHILEVMEGIG